MSQGCVSGRLGLIDKTHSPLEKVGHQVPRVGSNLPEAEAGSASQPATTVAQLLLTMGISDARVRDRTRTKKIEAPLENDRHLFARRVEEAAKVATAASIRIKKEAKERSAKKRKEAKERAKLNELLSKAANQTISVNDED